MKFSFTYSGEPVPASRPRFDKRGFAYTDPRYAKYKKDLAYFIRREFKDYLPSFPPKASKERTAYLKNNRYILILRVFRTVNRGDVDNHLKAIQDALQDARLFADDSQIDEARVTKSIDKMNPRIEFKLIHIQHQTQLKL